MVHSLPGITDREQFRTYTAEHQQGAIMYSLWLWLKKFCILVTISFQGPIPNQNIELWVIEVMFRYYMWVENVLALQHRDGFKFPVVYRKHWGTVEIKSVVFERTKKCFIPKYKDK